MSGSTPIGLEDPLLWRRIKWISTKAATAMGIMKCKEKNRFRVG